MPPIISSRRHARGHTSDVDDTLERNEKQRIQNELTIAETTRNYRMAHLDNEYSAAAGPPETVNHFVTESLVEIAKLEMQHMKCKEDLQERLNGGLVMTEVATERHKLWEELEEEKEKLRVRYRRTRDGSDLRSWDTFIPSSNGPVESNPSEITEIHRQELELAKLENEMRMSQCRVRNAERDVKIVRERLNWLGDHNLSEEDRRNLQKDIFDCENILKQLSVELDCTSQLLVQRKSEVTSMRFLVVRRLIEISPVLERSSSLKRPTPSLGQNEQSVFQTSSESVAMNTVSTTDSISHSNGDAHRDDSKQMIRCVICINDIERREALALPCGHVFHRVCISYWMSRKALCPICKFPVPWIEKRTRWESVVPIQSHLAL